MRRSRQFALILAGLTLLLAGLVVSDWLPALRGPAPETSEWYWPYLLRPLARWWAPLLAAAVFWLVSAWWLKQPRRRMTTVAGLGGLVVASLLLQLGLVYADRPAVAAELVDRTLANQTSGYFMAAAEVTDIHGLLRAFPEIMPTLPSEHTRTHPPGLILAQWLTIRAGAAASPLARAIWPLRCTDLWLMAQPAAAVAALGVWAVLPLVAAALTAVPLYFLGHELYGANVARPAAVFGAALPALLVFAQTPDQIFALLSAATLLAWLVALRRRSRRYAFLAGLLLSISTFLSLGNGALIGVLGVYALWHLYPRLEIQDLKWFLCFLVGLATVWLLYWLGWGVTFWEVARTGLQQHYDLVTSQRRYDWWVLHNLIDLLVFAGPIVVIALAAAMVVAVRRAAAGARLAADGLAIALALLIIALDLSGSARGEVGRLWLFFMPLLAVVAAGHLVSRMVGTRLLLLLLAAQLALAASVGLAWRPVEAVIVVAQRPAMPPVTTPTHELSAPFGEAIRLVGFDLEDEAAGPGGALQVTLYWQATGPAERPYTVFTHLVDQQGELVAQQDNWPVGGQWPPTCWRRDETIADPYTIQLPADLPAGTYALLVGLYDAADGTRLLTTGGLDALRLVDRLAIGD